MTFAVSAVRTMTAAENVSLPLLPWKIEKDVLAAHPIVDRPLGGKLTLFLSKSDHVIERILIVEDDHRMQKVLTRIFAREGFEVDATDNGRDALERFVQKPPTAVLLDLKLPELSGREVCRFMKERSPETPVVVLSSIADVVDKVLLLELGADDYVTKPFSPRELLARLQAAIRRQTRRANPGTAATFSFGDCTVDFEQMSARRAGRDVVMTTLEFKLLRFFVGNAGVVLSRELLLNRVWGYNAYPSTRTVDNQILKLRQKLERDPTTPLHLLTIYGSGYKFNP